MNITKQTWPLGLLLAGTALLAGTSTQAAQEWVARYDGGQSDYAQDITTDAAGNVYVTGYIGGDGWECATAKYDSAGSELWVRRYNYNPGSDLGDVALAIAVDISGNVYITGNTATGSGMTGYDILTVKYNTTGVFQWSAKYAGGAPDDRYDEGYDITVGSSGDVYVVGRSGDNFIMLRYDSAGTQQYVRIYGGGYAMGVSLDSAGNNVYATGTNGPDYFTVKCDPTLATEYWAAYYDGPVTGDLNDTAEAVAVDSSGNAYVTGYSMGSGTDYDIATVKFANSNGAQQWARRYDGTGGFDTAHAIVVDSAANLYVTGESAGAATGNDYVTIKYDASGTQQWASRYDGTGYDDNAYDIAIDDESPCNVYVTGESRGTANNWDYATVMYDSSGAEQWAMRYNGGTDYADQAMAIDVYDADSVYVTGYSGGDYATIKYNQQGGGPEIVKWTQFPDLFETGIDINANAMMGYVLADDFLCEASGPLTEIHVWGSWLEDYLPMGGDPMMVEFTLSIHSDIPAGPQGWSVPGPLLWMRTFVPGEFTVDVDTPGIMEGWMDPPDMYFFPADTICWEYTFYLDPSDFTQQGTAQDPIVYWLDVQANPLDPGALFGWKTSLEHWNDDAVWSTEHDPPPDMWQELRYPPGHQFMGESIDMAFQIIGEESVCPIALQPQPEVYSTPCILDTDCTNEAVCINSVCYAPKNRYLSFEPNKPGATVALRVKHPASGRYWWLDTPFLAAPGVWVSYLVNAPVYRVWTEPVVHAAGCAVSPNEVYDVQAIEATCDIADEASYSPALALPATPRPTPKWWADCVGGFAVSAWTPADGLVNMSDLQAVVQYFGGAATSPHLTWVDVDPQTPNTVVNMTDVQRVVNAFSGLTYPFSAPAACP